MIALQRKIAILGATGSIGTQALDIARRYPERFEVVCLTAHSSADKLFELVREFRPRVAALETEPAWIPEDVRFCEWVFGRDSSARALEFSGADDALCAVVGIAGLRNVWTALACCERVLLANKEALVTGGELVMARAREMRRTLLPVDSEHSAIFQCLRAREGNPVRRLVLTASGGALRDRTAKEIENASVEDVLRHPTWRMGAKITVDCATMLNKGLEVIEAHHLFGMDAENIRVVVHPESVVHSMVEFQDGAILAQLGRADMRGPIGYAMGFPERLPYGGEPLSLTEVGSLTFRAPDDARFPCLSMAYEALRAGANAPVVFNGANEAAVGEFLGGRVRFGEIARCVRAALDGVARREIRSLDDVFACDLEARAFARKFLGGRK
ncbi:MAG TPA: 1-deoxy-D-xylulose-5-phosphate reductoisomerase [Candidatus Pullichristensenella avicola]|nr:1-deoxy-D-xylulose-5-phosphate reductoisomerase [Candidatus Pullichristensenella avicola]